MALKATIFKADLHIADMARNYYAEHALTVARHPSETDERMMARILAFALNADERLAFGKGLSDADEPDLWQKDLTGAIEHWIEVGQPDEKRLLRACGRAARARVPGAARSGRRSDARHGGRGRPAARPLRPSVLAQIPEVLYRSPDMDRARQGL